MNSNQFSFTDWALLLAVVTINLATTAFYFRTSRDLKRAERTKMETERAVKYSIENRRAPVPLAARKNTGLHIVRE